MSPGITALIAARPTLSRIGLVAILPEQQAQWRLIEADSLQAALSVPPEKTPDVLLLDEHLHDLHGIMGLQQARALLPRVKLIVLVASEERDTVLDFIDAGAHGCLATSASPSQVLAAFNTVMCGGVFIPAASPEAIPSNARCRATPGPSSVSLTGRQRDVFDLMARGYSTKLIARDLGLAVGTVKVHLAAIYRLLGAHSRAEVVASLAQGDPALDQGYATAILDRAA